MARPFHLGQDRASVADVTLCLMPARRVSMMASLVRPLMIGLLPIALIACMNSAPTIAEEGAAVPLGADLGGSGPVATPAAAGVEHTYPQHTGEMQMAPAGHNDAPGSGTVNSVDPAGH